MVKRGIIPILVESLDRGHHYLDFACLAFLKKLSIITRNKDEIFSTGNYKRTWLGPRAPVSPGAFHVASSRRGTLLPMQTYAYGHACLPVMVPDEC